MARRQSSATAPLSPHQELIAFCKHKAGERGCHALLSAIRVTPASHRSSARLGTNFSHHGFVDQFFPGTTTF
jgi:hypothetical protein